MSPRITTGSTSTSLARNASGAVLPVTVTRAPSVKLAAVASWQSNRISVPRNKRTRVFSTTASPSSGSTTNTPSSLGIASTVPSKVIVSPSTTMSATMSSPSRRPFTDTSSSREISLVSAGRPSVPKTPVPSRSTTVCVPAVPPRSRVKPITSSWMFRSRSVTVPLALAGHSWRSGSENVCAVTWTTGSNVQVPASPLASICTDFSLSIDSISARSSPPATMIATSGTSSISSPGTVVSSSSQTPPTTRTSSTVSSSLV